MAVCEAAYALRAGDGAGGVDRGVQATLAHCQVCWVGTEDLMRLFRRVCSRLEVFMVRGRKDHWKVAIWQGGLECKARGCQSAQGVLASLSYPIHPKSCS